MEDDSNISCLNNLVKNVKALFSGRNGKNETLREAIEEFIEEDAENTATLSDAVAHERMLISNILKLRDMEVVDIMVPRANISAIDISSTKDDLIKLLAEKPHSRIPLYDGNLDNIVGVIYTKNIIAKISSKETPQLRDFMVEPLVISPAMRVMDLLLLLKKSRIHIAFVVDEFGGIDGLVTIGDLTEAIVGKISEENEFEIEPQMVERADGTALADAGYSILEFEKKYGNVFEEDEADEDVDTLAGLIINISGYMPARGEIIRHKSGIEFEILEADPRRIIRVRIKNLPKKQVMTN